MRNSNIMLNFALSNKNKQDNMEMTYYTNMQYYCGCWLSVSKRNELIQQGWTPSEWSRDTFYKKNKMPAYSSQIESNKIKHIGTEPRGCNHSVHNHQYNTDYYEVKRSDFNQMEHKPTLTNVCRPLRLHNFDGFVEPTQQERKGEGWTETYQRDFHTTITKHFFIVD